MILSVYHHCIGMRHICQGASFVLADGSIVLTLGSNVFHSRLRKGTSYSDHSLLLSVTLSPTPCPWAQALLDGSLLKEIIQRGQNTERARPVAVIADQTPSLHYQSLSLHRLRNHVEKTVTVKHKYPKFFIVWNADCGNGPKVIEKAHNLSLTHTYPSESYSYTEHGVCGTEPATAPCSTE